MFALPAALYSSADPNDGLLVSLASGNVSKSTDRFNTSRVLFSENSPAAFGLHDMMQGKRPRKFVFQNYREALLETVPSNSLTDTWRPAAGGWLGIDHYQVGWDQLKMRYRMTKSGNEARRRDSDRLCRHLQKHNPVDTLLLYPEKSRSSDSFVDDGHGDVSLGFLAPDGIFSFTACEGLPRRRTCPGNTSKSLQAYELASGSWILFNRFDLELRFAAGS